MCVPRCLNCRSEFTCGQRGLCTLPQAAHAWVKAGTELKNGHRFVGAQGIDCRTVGFGAVQPESVFVSKG